MNRAEAISKHGITLVGSGQVAVKLGGSSTVPSFCIMCNSSDFD